MHWPMMQTDENAISFWNDVLVPLPSDIVDNLPLSAHTKLFLSNHGIPSPERPYSIRFFLEPFVIEDERSNQERIVAVAEDDDDNLISCMDGSEEIFAVYFRSFKYVGKNLPSLLITLGRLRHDTLVILGGNRRNEEFLTKYPVIDLPFDLDESSNSQEYPPISMPDPPLIRKYQDQLNVILEDLGPLSDEPPLWLRCQPNDEHCFDDLPVLRRTLWILRDLARFDPAVFDTTRDLSIQWWPWIVEEAMKGFVRTL